MLSKKDDGYLSNKLGKEGLLHSKNLKHAKDIAACLGFISKGIISWASGWQYNATAKTAYLRSAKLGSMHSALCGADAIGSGREDLQH